MNETATRYNVLFLCTGNSARSILAEVLLNAMGADRFRAYSAGSRPKGQVNVHALKLLSKNRLRSRDCAARAGMSLRAADAPKMDFVFTVCDDAAGEVCPVWPGQPMTAHWGVPDPAAATGTEEEIDRAFFRAYEQLQRRISLFASLRLDKLDRLSLQKRIEEIGQTSGTVTPVQSRISPGDRFGRLGARCSEGSYERQRA